MDQPMTLFLLLEQTRTVSNFYLSLFSCGCYGGFFACLVLVYKSISLRGGRKGLRCCGFALFLVRLYGNFYFNARYCGFKKLSGLRLFQLFGRGFR